MTDKKLTLYAWEGNAAAVVYAVQGEHQSRSLVLTLIEARGGEGSPWGAESVDKPLDLTGMTAPRLYVEKPDGTQVVTDGEITDARKGVVTFRLTAQQLAAPGTAACQVVLTKATGEVLKVVGMQLDIQRSDLDDAIESSDEYPILVTLITQAQQAVDAAKQATASANTAAGNANTKAQQADTAAAGANAKAQAAQSAATACETATTAAKQATTAADTATANANAKARLADTAATNANAKAQAANTAAEEAKKAAKTITEARDRGDLQGAPGGVGLGNCNMIVGGDTVYTSNKYLVHAYEGYGLQAGRKYTVVIRAKANAGQKLLIAAPPSGGKTTQMTEVLPEIHMAVVAMPESATWDCLGIYNYPQETAKDATIDWISVYDGEIDNPPLCWTPSLDEVMVSDVAGRNLLLSSGPEKIGVAKWRKLDYDVSIPIHKGAVYTLSLWLRAERETTARIYVNDDTGGGRGYVDFVNSIAVNTQWRQYTFTSTALHGDGISTDRILLRVYGGADGDLFYAKNAKMERGSVATYWTPAPEDVNALQSQVDALPRPDSGTWIPTLTGYTGAYTVQSGNYTRYQGMVTVSATLALDTAYDASLAAQALRITGLPVPATQGLVIVQAQTDASTSLLGFPAGVISGDGVTLRVNTIAAKVSDLTWGQLVKGDQTHIEITISGTYVAAG